tara:strand:+ start:1265 stop:2209 length:945 start_codon:yes stop_codon:yes gene_type:complete
MTAQQINYSNFFETTLDGNVGASDTNITLSAAPTSNGTSAIAAPFYLVINPDSATREVILVTASSGVTMSTVTRDVEGRHTPDIGHTDGDTVRMAVVGEMFEDLHDQLSSGTITFTNKTFDAEGTGNALSNVDVANLKSGVLDTDISSVAGTDTTIPSAKAAKTYIDTKLSLAGGTMTGAINAGDQEISAAVLKDYSETDVVVSYGTDLAIDLANGNTGSVTLTGNVSGGIDFTNVPANGTSSFTLKITQDGTGSRLLDIDEITVNGGSHVVGLTPGNAGITLTTAANSVDLVTFLFFDAGTPLINALLDFKNS